MLQCIQNTLLQETYEEWEQCERKLKDIRVWIDKISNNLESMQFKKKPLRDQHGLCEKYLAEINGQKTKITLSIEKLQVNLTETLVTTYCQRDLVFDLNTFKMILLCSFSNIFFFRNICLFCLN